MIPFRIVVEVQKFMSIQSQDKRNLQLELLWGKEKEVQDHKLFVKKEELEKITQEEKQIKRYGRKGYGR